MHTHRAAVWKLEPAPAVCQEKGVGRSQTAKQIGSHAADVGSSSAVRDITYQVESV